MVMVVEVVEVVEAEAVEEMRHGWAASACASSGAQKIG